MANTIVSGNFPLDLEDVTKSWYDAGLKQYPALYKDVFNTTSSDKAYERYANYVGMTRMSEIDEGGAAPYDTARQLHDGLLRNVTYALASRITQQAAEDGQVLKIAEKIGKEFAKAEVVTMNVVAFNVLNRAHNNSYVGNDGKELCATDHATGVGTESNELAVAADFSEAMLEDLCVQISNAKGLNGEPIMISPKRLVLPNTLMFEHARILNSIQRAGTAENDINALKHLNILQNEPIFVPDGFYTDTDAVFILTSANVDDESLIHQVRKSSVITMDNDFDTDNRMMKIKLRCAFGWNSFYGIYSNGGGAA